jgi:hypothetical protein
VAEVGPHYKEEDEVWHDNGGLHVIEKLGGLEYVSISKSNRLVQLTARKKSEMSCVM